MSLNFSMPAEWNQHHAVWLAYPCDASLWEHNLIPAQEEFIALCEGIADIDPLTKKARGEKLNILLHPDFSEEAHKAKLRLAHLHASFYAIPYGDIWLRDTAPLFLKNQSGEMQALSFKFNSWGNKYDLPYDPEVSAEITKASKIQGKSIPWVCEGGALEFDGEGTCLTSRQCLLAKNRNPSLSQLEIEKIIQENLGIKKVLWVTDGLLNDHTDGHIDTIVRFVAAATVAIMLPSSSTDPNYQILHNLKQELEALEDAKGRRLKIIPIPSPGAVLNEEGELMPASYLNFYIGNSTVLVPTYGSEQDQAAVEAIAACFPSRRTIGLSAKAILSGGGAFHCITQQQARSKNED